jgi:hypothetical protein
MIEQKYIQAAIDYKKNVAGKFVLVEGAKLKQRIDGQRFAVTRKIDGHMQVVFFVDGQVTEQREPSSSLERPSRDGTRRSQVFMLNANGREKASEGLKCLDTFAEAVKAAGLKQAIIAAELYLPSPRPRCGDVQAALADDAKRDQLALAPFDIIELDGEAWKAEHYADTHNKLCTIFQNEQVKPVQMRNASSNDEVQQIYEEWVEGEGAEGLVVHSETPIVWKVKTRHTIDAAVIGYTTADRGIRDLMFAVRRPDGLFQMFARGSTGLTDDDRADIAKRLSEKHVESQYVLSDSRGIAYQMVKPESVFELSVIELVAKGNDDKVRTNALLTFDDQQGWLMNGMTPGVSAFGLVFEREREDKSPTPSDIRISQLTDLCPFEEQQATMGKLEKSQLLERRVFRKITGDKIMLHKFLIWKTNKERTGRYPAYIFFHTDYSSGRKDILKRDMSYSSDEQQIRSILASEMESNIKKGWEEVA